MALPKKNDVRLPQLQDNAVASDDAPVSRAPAREGDKCRALTAVAAGEHFDLTRRGLPTCTAMGASTALTSRGCCSVTAENSTCEPVARATLGKKSCAKAVLRRRDDDRERAPRPTPLSLGSSPCRLRRANESSERGSSGLDRTDRQAQGHRQAEHEELTPLAGCRPRLDRDLACYDMARDEEDEEVLANAPRMMPRRSTSRNITRFTTGLM